VGDGRGLPRGEPEVIDRQLFALCPAGADLVADVADRLARHRDPVEPRTLRPRRCEQQIDDCARVRVIEQRNQFGDISRLPECQCLLGRLAVLERGVCEHLANVGVDVVGEHGGGA
jgi:hypothetical protein